VRRVLERVADTLLQGRGRRWPQRRLLRIAILVGQPDSGEIRLPGETRYGARGHRCPVAQNRGQRAGIVAGCVERHTFRETYIQLLRLSCLDRNVLSREWFERAARH